MKKKLLPPLISLFIASGLIIYLLSILNSASPKLSQNTPCIPTFADGGGPHYIDDVPSRSVLAPAENNGQRLVVRGRVLRRDCKTPVTNAILNIWHADENGEYQNAWYRGKVGSKNDGSYTFETVIPKGYGQGTAFRPPHIHFKVFIDNHQIITSQMFFPDVKGRDGFNDGYIMNVEEKSEWGDKTLYANHDIILPF